MLDKYFAAVAALFFACLGIGSPAAASTTLSGLYVFGDSTVDSGNFLIQAAPGAVLPLASKGYFEGRWSNGYNYADKLSLAMFGTPTTASLSAGGGNNYAYGGARIVTNADFSPDLSAQLAAYTAASGGVADANALYLLSIGGNDLPAMAALLGSPAQFNAYRNNLINAYSQAVAQLDAMGARNILVMGVPGTSALPFSLQLDGDFQTALNGLSLNPTTSLYRYNVRDRVTQIEANPAAFGLPADVDTINTCHAIITPAAGMDCSHYVKFDMIGHRTEPVQQAIFEGINAQFGFATVNSAVPEPTTWLLMIVGFGFVGASLRRRESGATRSATAF